MTAKPPALAVRDITTDEKTAMQKALKELGLYTDVVDGRWGRNSMAAMAQWQKLHDYPTDGIPTYTQMVALGATVPIVLPKPRSSIPGGLLTLLLKAVPLFFSFLPKVNFPMNPVLLALSRVNKATITTLVGAVAMLLLLFGIDLKPDTQGIIITVGAALITGITTWLVPNAPPAPLAALGLLQTSLKQATGSELLEYNQAQWPADDGVVDIPQQKTVYANGANRPAPETYDGPALVGDSFGNNADAGQSENSTLTSGPANGGADAPRTGV